MKQGGFICWKISQSSISQKTIFHIFVKKMDSVNKHYFVDNQL